MSLEIPKYLQDRLLSLGVRASDIQETFVHSGGKGGQNVNKVATCVLLRHLPTGLLVRCETERSQVLNRVLARKRLADALEHREREKKKRAKQAAELIRRQKRRPSKAARRRNVESKRHHGDIKRQRQKPRNDE